MSDGSASKPILNVADNGMLISSNIADAPTQRFYVTTLFVLLQALKFYDYIQLYGSPPSAETVFVLKWISIDAIFLLVLPKLKIPWLSFRFYTTLLQIALISAVNVCLSARIPFTISSIAAALLKFFYDRELSVLEHNVKVSDIIHNSSRILGRHTVNILPESTARISPLVSCFCVGGTTKKSTVTIPIRLNSTIPHLLAYSRIDPDTNDVVNYNLTGKALKHAINQADRSSKVWELPLTIREPGMYRLERVQDTSKLDVHLLESQFLVVRCPSAAITIPENLSSRRDRCTGDSNELSIRAYGLPPLRVKYNSWIEGRESVRTMDSVKPLDYSSPLMISHHEPVENITQQIQSLKGISDLTWAQPRSVDIPLNSALTRPGTWSYAIEEVEDACGNVVNYSRERKSHSRESLAALPKSAQPALSMISETLTYEFRVHDRPRIAFHGCSIEHPASLLAGQTSKLSFEVKSAENGPYQLEIGHEAIEKQVSEPKEKDISSTSINLTSKHQAFVVKEEGLYFIKDFRSEHCKGIIEVPSSCAVVTPPQPALNVSFEPILDKCAGSIGLLADLSLTGTPPFDIAWKEKKTNGNTTMHRKKIHRARHPLKLIPEEEGHFSYEFTSLDDANYKGISLLSANLKTEQVVYPLAGAQFSSIGPKKCCIGDFVSIDVRLVGSGPWDLVYEIIHAGQRQRREMKGLVDSLQMIKTPSLSSGGTHTVTLISVQDANGCKTPLEERDFVIEVRRERPSAAFYPINDKRSITVVKGSPVDIPLRLTGDGPWEITYESPVKQEIFQTRNPNADLRVSTPGQYKLLHVTDAFCPGKVNEKANGFDLQWFTLPRISIPQSSAEFKEPQRYIRRDVCEGDDDTFNVEISGAPPFVVTYERTHVGHKGVTHDKQSHELSTVLPLVSIKAKTSPPGTWKYTFLGVSDTHYERVADQTSILEIEQFVNSRPVAAFAEADKTYNYCSEVDIADQEADLVPLKFQGEAPFQVRFRIKHEMSSSVDYPPFQDIHTHTWDLRISELELTLGSHIVSIAEVTDAKGCSRKYTDKDSRIHVVISELPSIVPVSSRTEFCVGDRLSYAVQGIPPFKIEYEFNKAKKRATVSGPVFSRVAEQPGNFSILSLSDSASKCKVAVNGLEKVIHDIPSVRVSEGKNIVESIHEGDQAEIIFHLYGTPPFSLTYTRLEIDRSRKEKVLDTHTVSGIWENTYVVRSSLAGTYAATEVHDAFCRISLHS